LNYFQNAVNHLNEIKWEQVGSVKEPWNMALIKEYIRRVSVFVTTNSLKTPYPFLNAAKAIGRDIQLDIYECCPNLKIIDNSLIIAMCTSYIQWAVLIDNKDDCATKFPDIYEPLIKLYEKSGSVNYRNGEILAGGYAFPLATPIYMAKHDPIDITEEGLNNYSISM